MQKKLYYVSGEIKEQLPKKPVGEQFSNRPPTAGRHHQSNFDPGLSL